MQKSNICIVGPMCSGKSTLARELQKRIKHSEIVSLATPIKEIAKKYFKMKQKDRTLLQKIGEFVRTTNKAFCANYLIEEKLHEKNENHRFLIVDDCRDPEDVAKLVEKGFYIFVLQEQKSVLKERAIRLYNHTLSEIEQQLNSKIEQNALCFVENKHAHDAVVPSGLSTAERANFIMDYINSQQLLV